MSEKTLLRLVPSDNGGWGVDYEFDFNLLRSMAACVWVAGDTQEGQERIAAMGGDVQALRRFIEQFIALMVEMNATGMCDVGLQ